MARKRLQEETVPLNVRLPKELYEQLSGFCVTRGHSKAFVVQQSVINYLKNAYTTDGESASDTSVIMARPAYDRLMNAYNNKLFDILNEHLTVSDIVGKGSDTMIKSYQAIAAKKDAMAKQAATAAKAPIPTETVKTVGNS